MLPPGRELSAEQVRRQCDASRCRLLLQPKRRIGGDHRPGSGHPRHRVRHRHPYPGYNIYAMGPSGAGKTSTIISFLEPRAAARPVPPDWGYIRNFADPDRRERSVCHPRACQAALRVDQLLVHLAETLSKVFNSDEYAAQRNTLEREVEGAAVQTARGA